VYPRPSGDQTRSVERFELVEVGVVHHPGQHVPGVEGRLEVVGHDPEQFFGVVAGRCRLLRGGPPFAPVQAAHDPSSDADGVGFVAGQVIGQTGGAGVHGRPTQRFVVGLLAVAIFTNGGPPRNTFDRPSTITTWSDMPGT
jgi:hypothetical protein